MIGNNSMSLTDIPEGIIVRICKFMKPIEDDAYSDEKDDHFSERLIHIYKLIRTCKSFDYLKNYSFLMHRSYGEYDDIFYLVNYLGIPQRPEYWRLCARWCNKWSGYKDDKNEFYTIMKASNYGYHVINDKKYEFYDIKFEDMMNDIYEKKFHDKEIIDYAKTWPWVNCTIVRKSFPIINISQVELNEYLEKYKSK